MAEYDGTSFRNDDPDTPLEASVLNDWNRATVDHGKRIETIESADPPTDGEDGQDGTDAANPFTADEVDALKTLAAEAGGEPGE